MANPLIQIDDEVREMTDQEYAEYLETEASFTPVEPQWVITQQLSESPTEVPVATKKK